MSFFKSLFKSKGKNEGGQPDGTTKPKSTQDEKLAKLNKVSGVKNVKDFRGFNAADLQAVKLKKVDNQNQKKAPPTQDTDLVKNIKARRDFVAIPSDESESNDSNSSSW